MAKEIAQFLPMKAAKAQLEMELLGWVMWAAEGAAGGGSR